MKIKFISLFILQFCFIISTAQVKSNEGKIVVHVSQGKQIINKDIYGHFAEHLGNCIYGGIWVGENSPIPNTRGIRNDIVQALKNLNIPNLRWPGGCFADTYHWKDGIGPREKRPTIVNVHWGGVTEDNSFGTHEFMDLCSQLGCEPYISGNVGSGSVQETAEWIEYLTFDGKSPMADLRKKNGHEKPWKVKFFGIGNEAWGCGGDMTPDYYANEFRRYSSYTRNFGENKLYKIASGADATRPDRHLEWTETLLKNIPSRLINGISLHYYTVDWNNKSDAVDFTEKDYFKFIKKAIDIESIIKLHSAVMDKYDPSKKIGLMVDEWGGWWNVEKGTNPGFLYQQNTMRDAMIAAVSLNILNNNAERVQMANIAQVINVLQSVILTKNEKMVLTPTYHIFEMYKVHQGATLLPLDIQSPEYIMDGENIAAISSSASKDKNGKINITIANIDHSKAVGIKANIDGIKVSKVSGRVLTAGQINAHNSFDNPENVKPAVFKDMKLEKGNLNIYLPAKSVVVITLE